MDYIKDLIYVNKATAKKTVNSLKTNWIIIFTGIIYTILNIVAFSIIGRLFVGPLFIVSGIIMAIITSSFISNYLYLLFNVINYNRITINDFKEGFTYFIWKIYGVLFIAYLGEMILSFISRILGPGAVALNLIIGFAILILFNPIPETLYIKDLRPLDSLTYTMEFMQENWLNWLIPNAVFMFLIYSLTGNMLLGLFNTHIGFNMFFSARNILIYLLGQIIFSFAMIYRGHLYKLLSGSTRRKRMFMNKF